MALGGWSSLTGPATVPTATQWETRSGQLAAKEEKVLEEKVLSVNARADVSACAHGWDTLAGQ